jgi:hypothetical protein
VAQTLWCQWPREVSIGVHCGRARAGGSPSVTGPKWNVPEATTRCVTDCSVILQCVNPNGNTGSWCNGEMMNNLYLLYSYENKYNALNKMQGERIMKPCSRVSTLVSPSKSHNGCSQYLVQKCTQNIRAFMTNFIPVCKSKDKPYRLTDSLALRSMENLGLLQNTPPFVSILG